MRNRIPNSRLIKNFSSRIALPPWHPNADPIFQAHITRMAEMDIAFQQEFREMNRRLPLFVLLRMKGGSGFRMASLLRQYFLEYLHRLTSHGPYSLSTSFNWVQAFLSYNDEFKIFDLRQEKEQLLRLHDYFDWYTIEQKIPEDPKILLDVMKEGQIYSFDLAGDTGEYTISTAGSNLAIAGVSLIRHRTELSVILLAGENPPNPKDSELPNHFKEYSPVKGRENISPAPDLSIEDRYLEGMPGFSKVIVLARFDLQTQKYDVKSVNIDIGFSFIVHTDDNESVKTLPEIDKNNILGKSTNQISRYGQLFSALSSLIYLPVIFIAEHHRVVESKFVTDLYINKQKHHIKKATKEFKNDTYCLHRVVKCLSSPDTANLIRKEKQVIDPPDFSFESSGFWKPLEPNTIGTDKDGNPIVGKTWVERYESYSTCSPESFIIQNVRHIPKGDDPGVVYIIRSASHGNDIYKVGLTRRSAEKRAQEISSSTGVPLPFGVLATWEVGDCGKIEKETHILLKQYRVNKKREFFRASLSTIIAAIEQTIAEFEKSH